MWIRNIVVQPVEFDETKLKKAHVDVTLVFSPEEVASLTPQHDRKLHYMLTKLFETVRQGTVDPIMGSGDPAHCPHSNTTLRESGEVYCNECGTTILRRSDSMGD